jgi:hypothetical protein
MPTWNGGKDFFEQNEEHRRKLNLQQQQFGSDEGTPTNTRGVYRPGWDPPDDAFDDKGLRPGAPKYYTRTDSKSIEAVRRDRDQYRERQEARRWGATDDDLTHMYDRVPADDADPTRRLVRDVRQTQRTVKKISSLARMARGTKGRRR